MSETESVVSEGRVAVVTGAASGIGLAMAHKFAEAGMHVVMADIEKGTLETSAAGVAADGGSVLSVVTDVSDAAQVHALRDAALQEYGAVHLVCNNAGVAGPYAPLWEVTRGDLEWVIGVNMWGVINGIQAFMPVLVEQNFGHVLNTASIFGLVPFGAGVYAPTKAAIISISESLHMQLRDAGSAVGVSVLIAAAVQTKLQSSERNRPSTLGPQTPLTDVAKRAQAKIKGLPPGQDPSEVGELVFNSLRDGTFYIHTDPGWIDAILNHAKSVATGIAPRTELA